jgi:hypothetical protein
MRFGDVLFVTNDEICTEEYLYALLKVPKRKIKCGRDVFITDNLSKLDRARCITVYADMDCIAIKLGVQSLLGRATIPSHFESADGREAKLTQLFYHAQYHDKITKSAFVCFPSVQVHLLS